MPDKIATFEWLHTNKSNLIKVGVTMPNNKKGVTKSDVNTYLNTSTGFYYNKLNNQLLAQSEIWGNDINFLKVRDLIKLNNGKFLITGTFNIQSNLNKIAIINEETNSIDNDSFDLNYKFDGAYPDKVFKLQNGDLLFQSGHILDQNLNLVRKINFLGKIIRVTNDNKFFTIDNVTNSPDTISNFYKYDVYGNLDTTFNYTSGWVGGLAEHYVASNTEIYFVRTLVNASYYSINFYKITPTGVLQNFHREVGDVYGGYKPSYKLLFDDNSNCIFMFDTTAPGNSIDSGLKCWFIYNNTIYFISNRWNDVRIYKYNITETIINYDYNVKSKKVSLNSYQNFGNTAGDINQEVIYFSNNMIYASSNTVNPIIQKMPIF